MKILSFDPRSLASPADLDQSRLAYHARGIELSSLVKLKHGIVLLGLADDAGVKNVGGRPGAKDGPAAVRQKLYKFTWQPNLPLYDLGDLLPGSDITETHRLGTDVVEAILKSGHFPLVVGGGHDLGFPHALGFQRSHPGSRGFFWNIDAHLDVRPTDRGITSGSPWYLLREHAEFSPRSKIVEFGLQRHCNATALIRYAEANDFQLHWLPDIRRRKGPADYQFAKLLKKMPTKAAALVSLDIDCVNWAEAPGCSAPQTEGFSASEVIGMSLAAGAMKQVKTFGIFELSPALDPDGRTANLVAHCLAACMRGIGQRHSKK